MSNQATVIQTTANFVIIKDYKEVFKAVVRGKLLHATPILVGDKVLYHKTKQNTYVIETILPRKNQLFRPKIANVDQVLIVNALTQPAFNSLILNKLLTIFHFYQIAVVLVFTKQDLVTENDPVWGVIQQYRTLEYPIYCLSNQNKIGIDQLIPLFQQKLSLLTGLSGVGKSSLLNNLERSLNITTKTVSQITEKGRHTTTSTNLYFLHDGMIADSPGYMTLQLVGFSANDIAHNFPGLTKYFNQCKFRNCLHQQEPGCAVTADLNNSTTAFFYQNYCKILKEFENYQSKE